MWVAVVLLMLAISCAIYPSGWRLPRALAGLFGPFMLVRMGSASGMILIVALVAALIPWVVKPNIVSRVLAALALLLWYGVGYAASAWLYA